MSDRVSADEARRLVVEVNDAELWQLAFALDRDGPAFDCGVPARLVADVLEVGEPENWERTTRARERAGDLFVPFCEMPKDDGKTYRSWLPSDLGDDDESRLRAFAGASKNVFVRARVFEILWARFHRFADAEAAMDARFASAKLCDAEKDWPRLVKNIGRLTTLIVTLNANARLQPLTAALDEAADALAACSRPFAFPVLADMVCNTVLTKKAGRDAFTAERGNRWADRLTALAERFRGDHLHGHDALMVLQAWHGRWGEAAQVTAVRRRVVEHLSAVAGTSPGLQSASLHQRALQAALDFGLPDLAQTMRRALMTSITTAIPEFKQVSGAFTLPAPLLAEIDRLFTTVPNIAAAVRQLALFPGLLELDLEQLRASAREQLRDAAFLAMTPTVHYHPDGKVTFRSNDPEGNLERHVAFLASGHLAFVEGLLRYALARVMARIEPATLVHALAEWPHLPQHRRSILAVAAERFAKGDWISSGFMVLTLYEAVLRDLLRAGGYSALKVEPGGVQMDETLNSLLRSSATRSVLGDGHCDLVEHVMCEPALGWNLRNEVAHGTARPESLTPMRVFLGWLLLIRLTCFVAGQEQPPAAGDSSAPPAPETLHDGASEPES